MESKNFFTSSYKETSTAKYLTTTLNFVSKSNFMAFKSFSSLEIIIKSFEFCAKILANSLPNPDDAPKIR